MKLRKAPLAALFLFLSPMMLLASPKYVRLSFATAHTGTEMGISWNTDEPEDTIVQYGTTTSYGHEAQGTSFQATGALNYVHEVVLTGLSPSTTYHYRAGSPSGGWSSDFSFLTAQPGSEQCSFFTFVVLGDSRSEIDWGPSPIFYNLLLEALINEEPAFVLHGGDIVHEGGQVHQWVNELAAIDALTPYYSLMYTIGNHDDGPEDGPNAYYNQIYQLPLNPDSKVGEFSTFADVEDFYYFTYADAIFVSLSTQTFKDFDMQARWLDEVLTANPKKWKFVFFHHPIYASNPLGLFHDPNEQGQNPYLVPIFDKHHVDIVFTSHNHFYERFAPSYGGYGDDAQPVDSFDDGTVYVVTGGGGATTAPIGLCSAEGTVACSGRNHYLSVTIRGNELTYEARSTEAQRYGLPRGRLIDRFEILKGGANPCQ